MSSPSQTSPAQASAIRDVVTITGLSETSARALLAQFSWNLSRAINGYYSGDFRQPSKGSAGSSGGGGQLSSSSSLGTAKNSTTKSKSSSSSSSVRALEELFDKYADATTGRIGIDGTIQYIQDLGLKLEDAGVLALAMVLKSPEIGQFDRAPFVAGWLDLGIDNLGAMKLQAAQYQRALVTDSPNADEAQLFKDVYQFAFKYNLTPGQRVLPLETAVDYWRLLLGPVMGHDHLDKWLDYMTNVYQKSVSRDTWNMYLEFVNYWKTDPELAGYDPAGAWPSVIDDFVQNELNSNS